MRCVMDYAERITRSYASTGKTLGQIFGTPVEKRMLFDKPKTSRVCGPFRETFSDSPRRLPSRHCVQNSSCHCRCRRPISRRVCSASAKIGKMREYGGFDEIFSLLDFVKYSRVPGGLVEWRILHGLRSVFRTSSMGTCSKVGVSTFTRLLSHVRELVLLRRSVITSLVYRATAGYDGAHDLLG